MKWTVGELNARTTRPPATVAKVRGSAGVGAQAQQWKPKARPYSFNLAGNHFWGRAARSFVWGIMWDIIDIVNDIVYDNIAAGGRTVWSYWCSAPTIRTRWFSSKPTSTCSGTALCGMSALNSLTTVPCVPQAPLAPLIQCFKGSNSHPIIPYCFKDDQCFESASANTQRDSGSSSRQYKVEWCGATAAVLPWCPLLKQTGKDQELTSRSYQGKQEKGSKNLEASARPEATSRRCRVDWTPELRIRQKI